MRFTRSKIIVSQTCIERKKEQFDADPASATMSQEEKDTRTADLKKKQQDAETRFTMGQVIWQEDILRTKRCLLQYLNKRLQVIRSTKWVEGRVLSDEKLAKLSAEEIEYLNKYNDIVDDYIQDWLPNAHALNLHNDCELQQVAFKCITIAENLSHCTSRANQHPAHSDLHIF